MERATIIVLVDHGPDIGAGNGWRGVQVGAEGQRQRRSGLPAGQDGIDMSVGVVFDVFNTQMPQFVGQLGA